MCTKLLTLEDVANMLGIPLNTAKKLAAKKNVNFPKSFKVGRSRKWIEEVVYGYMNGDPNMRA